MSDAAKKVFLAGLGHKDEKPYNQLSMCGTRKLELKFGDDSPANPNMLDIEQSNKLLRYLYTFVCEMTPNQAKQIIGVLVSAGVNIFVNDDRIGLRADSDNISHSNFILHCVEAEKDSDISVEKVIYSLFRQAGYDVTNDYKKQSCLTAFSCNVCRFITNYLYTLWNISRCKVAGTQTNIPTTATHTCKAHRLMHSNMLITNCNYKPIYYTDITQFCPYCGGRLDIIDI